MKTIKELEEHLEEVFVKEEGYLQALKDVLKLIDEIPSHSWEGHECILVEELKARIEGKK